MIRRISSRFRTIARGIGRRSAAVGLSLFALSGIGVLTSDGRPAIAEEAPFHLQTFVKLEGNFTQQHATTWADLARYITYLDTDQRGANGAHDAGIRVGFYTDVHLICEGTTCSGSPPPSAVAESGYAHDCSGRRVYTPDDSPALRKMLGNPTSPALSKSLNDAIARMRDNNFGHFNYDFVFDDDVFIPDKPWYPWHAGSPKGTLLRTPFCGYTSARYTEGIKSIESRATLPVIFNGLNAPENITYVQHASNVIGGMCEDCLHVNYDVKDRNREPSPFWNSEMDAALAAAARNKVWIAYPHGQFDNETQGYVYASLMLAYNHASTTLNEDVTTPSGVPLPPTILLVPTHPLRGQTAVHIAQLRRSGGAYAREFGACYIAGMRVGPCAAAVNPSSTETVDLPFPRGRYRHTLVISGTGVIHELGDTGTISADGPAPADRIEPRGWRIVFR